MPKRNPYRVLFLCTGNACRSQMAEGWARQLHGDRIQAMSAGVAPHGLDPLAVEVMREAGVDISGQRSEPVDAYLDPPPDLVVTVCDRAAEACPVFPAAVRSVHHGFADPPRLAQTLPDDRRLEPYRRVRDEIRDFVATLPELLG